MKNKKAIFFTILALIAIGLICAKINDVSNIPDLAENLFIAFSGVYIIGFFTGISIN